MALSNIRSKIVSTSKKKQIPGVVIDVLGGLCTVKLSDGTGRILQGIKFFGSIPSVGSNASIDFSKGDPIAMISPEPDNKISSGKFTGSPFVTASASTKYINTEVPDSKRYGNVYYRGLWSTTIEYTESDLVFYDGAFYLCLDGCIGVSLANANYWQVFSTGESGAWSPVSAKKNVEAYSFYKDGPIADYENLFIQNVFSQKSLSAIRITSSEMDDPSSLTINMLINGVSSFSTSFEYSEDIPIVSFILFPDLIEVIPGNVISFTIADVSGDVMDLQISIYEQKHEILFNEYGAIMHQEGS